MLMLTMHEGGSAKRTYFELRTPSWSWCASIGGDDDVDDVDDADRQIIITMCGQ